MPAPHRIPPVHRATAVTDLPLFAAREARDEGIARASAKMDPEWSEAAMDAIRSLAVRVPTFIVDDVWLTGLAKPTEARALGAVMLRAAREGIIRRTKEYRPSAQVGNHANPRVVWASLIHRVSDAA